MELNSRNFIFDNENQWTEVGEGIRRQILGYDTQIMTVKVEFQTGGIGALHAHPHSQTTCVFSGVFEFQIDKQTNIVQAGDSLYIPPNVMHGTKCLEEGILIDNFAPMRDDFLNKT